MKYHPDYKTAVLFQRLLVADAQSAIDPLVRCKVVETWDKVSDRKRILLKIPKPKDQEVTKPEPKIKAQPIAEE